MTDLEALVSALNPIPESGPGSQVEVPTFESVWAAAQRSSVPRGVDRLTGVPMQVGRGRRAWAVVGSAGGLLAAGLATVLLLLSSGPAPAYAGWTAIPAAPSPSAVSTALKTCGAMNFGRKSRHSLPAPILTEARGRYVAVVSVYHGQATACVTDGPDSSSQTGLTTFSTPSVGHIGAPVMYGSNAPGFPGSERLHLSAMAKRLITELCAPLQKNMEKACMTRGRQNARGHVTVAFGRAGTGVTQVAFELPHRPVVQATVEHGWYFAWWPWRVWPSNARVTSQSGTANTPVRNPDRRG